MKPEKIFRRYDVRGKYPEEIDEQFAERMGKALGTFVSERSERIVVLRDTKKSSETLKNKLIRGLRSTGVEALDAGVGPTDMAALLGNRNCAFSVQVTSSHMPLGFNGFKFMYPDGNGFVNEDLEEVKEIFRSEDFSSRKGKVMEMDDPVETYKQEVKRFLGSRGIEKIDQAVAVETMGGGAYRVLPELLEELGAEVIDVSEDLVKNPPDPREENLSELEEAMEKADVGIATDLDGDRLKIYRDGFLSGDEVFGMLASHIRGPVVASVDTSRLIEEVVDEVFYTRVGDPFVMDKAVEEEVELAGEPNGHYALLDFVPYNSGTVAALFLIGKGFPEVPEYYSTGFSVEVENREEKMQELVEDVEEKYGVISRIDGIKFELGEARVLLRPSGSSEKIRVKIDSRERIEVEDEVRELFGKHKTV